MLLFEVMRKLEVLGNRPYAFLVPKGGQHSPSHLLCVEQSAVLYIPKI